MKTAHPGLRSRSHFQSLATHKHLSNPDHQFSDPNHEKISQMSPHGSPKGIPNPPKIYKHPCLDSHVSPWVSLGTPGSLKWYSKAPKWCPNGVPITPNGVPITQNGHKLPIAIHAGTLRGTQEPGTLPKTGCGPLDSPNDTPT